MGAISTTSFTEPLTYPNTAMIDRENFDGDMWFAKRTSATVVDIFKSTNNGASWTGPVATITRANLQEVSGIFMDSNGHLHMLLRVYESGSDRIYYYRLGANNTGFDTEQFVVGASTGAAGGVYTGMDLVVIKLASTYYVHMAIGTTDGVNGGTTLFSATVTLSGSTVFTMRNTLITGTRQWLNGPPGIVHPKIDFAHTGDHKSPSSSPDLWLAWGRSTIYTAKAAWSSGPTWTAPAYTPPAVSSLGTAQPSNSAVYDAHGSRWLVAYPVGSLVRIAERAVDNATQIPRDTPTHPAGTVRHCTLGVSSATSSMRIFAVGTTDNKLYFVDYDRLADAWGTWATVSAADIIGARNDNYCVRGVNYGNGHYDLVIATGSTPFNLISTSSTAAAAPNTPVITTPANGNPQDVAAALPIAWTFSDPDPDDFQNSYALRRTIGATTTYWNASTSTWDGSEVYNASGTTGVTLASGWGNTSDATHFYAVRVKDQQGNSSPYSTQVRVTPDAKANPTITAPTAAPTSALITVSWTVSSQSAYRIVLLKSGVVIRDTGWVTSTATSVQLPDQLLAQAYVLNVTTRSAKGLTSNTATLNFTPAYTPPASATFNLAGFNTLGLIRASVTNPDPVQPQPLVVSNDVYRRKIGDTGSGVKVGTIPTTTPLNLVAPFNSGFEGTDSSGSWGTAGANSTAVRDATNKRTGGWAFMQTSTAGVGFSGINFGPLNQFAAAPGDQFYLEFWFKATSTRQIGGQVGWRTAANGPNNVPSAGALLAATNTWQKYSMTSGAAPANTAFAYPTLAVCSNTLNTGEQMWVDDVVFYKSTATAGIVTYDDFMAASGVGYEYSVVTTGVNGAVTQSAWSS